MGRFSKDADVLRVDSAVFAEAMGLPVLCKGDGGVIAGTTAEWDKAEYFRRMYERARQRCRLWLDGDEDGQGDTAIDGGTLRLHRE